MNFKILLSKTRITFFAVLSLKSLQMEKHELEKALLHTKVNFKIRIEFNLLEDALMPIKNKFLLTSLQLLLCNARVLALLAYFAVCKMSLKACFAMIKVILLCLP